MASHHDNEKHRHVQTWNLYHFILRKEHDNHIPLPAPRRDGEDLHLGERYGSSFCGRHSIDDILLIQRAVVHLPRDV
jgi:hypothetical protein